MSSRALWLQSAIVLLTLAALALGGTVDLWAQTLVVTAAGLLILIAPPRGPLASTPLIVAGLLMAIGLMAFLPSPPANSSAWRHYLLFECNVPSAIVSGPTHAEELLPYRFPFADTWSPQPWLSLQACALLFIGLAWALYLFQQEWDKDSRIFVALMLVYGVAFVALVAALAFIIGFHVPGWHQQENRGWFPNRNQTADVLAVVGVVNYALIFDRLRKGGRSGYLLLFALVPILTELIISFSRAGILLFFGGIVLWHLWPRKGEVRGGSVKWAALSAALGLVLVAIFLIWGGDTLHRFQGERNVNGAEDFSNFRGAIQADALRFSLESPFLGTGLGNFEPLFSFSREHSINASRAIHPESDWLWIAGEMGWGAPILLIIGIIWWARRCLPLENKSGETMRRAFIVGIVVFIVHGLVDVSGHRIGSLWVALLIASLARATRPTRLPSRITPILFRGLAVVMLVIAAWWSCSERGMKVPPTTVTLTHLKERIFANADSLPRLESTARLALLIAPLDWSLYTQLAYAEVFQPGKMEEARANFQTARALNPYWIALFINEGHIWSTANEPDLCLDAWRDGLRRSGPQAPEAFRQMIDIAPPHSVEREGLAELAMNRNDFLLMILPTSSQVEAEALLSHLLQSDPQLIHFTPGQRLKLFKAWWSQGDQVQLMNIVRQHPEWMSTMWIYQAQFAAKENDFQRACEIATKWVPPPQIPNLNDSRPLAQLQQEFATANDNLTSGIALYLAEVKAGNSDEALLTLGKLMKIPDHPHYLAYLQAQLYSMKQDWKSAWDAWQIYINP